MGLNVGKLAGGAVSSIPVVGDVLGAIGSLFGGGKPNHATDPRWIENNNNYIKALTGDMDALRILKARAGISTETVNGVVYGKHRDGVGDLTADALAKYTAVVAAASKGSGGAATAVGPQGNTPASQAADAAKTIAGMPVWLGLALLAGGAFFLTKRR